jgi:uncharacterized phage protein (TIGR02218 family)
VKTLSVGLSAHFATGSTTIAYCLVFTRADGQVFRFTSHDMDLVVSGATYRAGPGLEVSDLVLSAGLAPDNLELRILYADDAITRADLLAGRWDGATFRLFSVNYADTAAGTNELLTGTTGEVRVARDDAFTLELRGLKQALQRTHGIVTQKTCRHRLGDTGCGVDLAPYTVTDTVSSVTSSRVFTSSGLAAGSPTFVAGWFQEGVITFTSGDNIGLSRKVKDYSVGGQISCLAPFPFAIANGDAFSIIAGCAKRLEEDCRDKFDNVLNFGGEPHLPGVDSLTAVPDVGTT